MGWNQLCSTPRPQWWVLLASFWLVFSQGPLRVRLCVIYSHYIQSYCNLEMVQKCLCMWTDCCRESAGLGEACFLPQGGSLTVLSLARVPTHVFQLARKWCHPLGLGRGQGDGGSLRGWGLGHRAPCAASTGGHCSRQACSPKAFHPIEPQLAHL